jgi:hypothetical protein
MFMAKCRLRTRERVKGTPRSPLQSPRPRKKSVLRTAFASRPAACGRFDSSYSPHPWGSPFGPTLRCSKSFRTILSCLDKPQSAIPGGLTLPSGLRLTDFSGDSPPRCTLCARGHKDVAVVVMRENESAMVNKVEDVHSIYFLQQIRIRCFNAESGIALP